MGGHVALAHAPFGSRVWEGDTIVLSIKLLDLLAALALLHDGLALASHELATLVRHKCTINTLLYYGANHGYHILSFLILFFLKGELTPLGQTFHLGNLNILI